MALMSPLDYSTFSLLRAWYKFLSKKCYESYIKQVETSFCAYSKFFWDFVRENKKISNLPSAVILNGITSVNSTTMYKLFSQHFSSAFSPENINVDISSSGGIPYDLPSSCNIILSDVESSLVKLRLTKLVGPDVFSVFFIYNLRCVLYFPLFLIYNKSLSGGVFPDIWKTSSVTTLFKLGDTKDASYIPFSIYQSSCQTTRVICFEVHT